MTDVIKKIFSNRAVHQGYAVVSAGKTPYGASSGIFLEPTNHYPVEPSGIRADYELRFDDVRYYAGDTAS